MSDLPSDQKIEYVCPLCETRFRAGANRAGTTIPCPACKEPVLLSHEPEPPAGERAPSPIRPADGPEPTYGRGLNGFSRRHAWVHLVTALVVLTFVAWRVGEWVHDRSTRATNFTRRLTYDCATPEAGARAQFQMVADHNADALNAVAAAEQLSDGEVQEARLALESMEVARVARWTWPTEALATVNEPSRHYAFVFVKYRRPETPSSQPPWRLRYVVLGLRQVAERWVPSADARASLTRAKTSPRSAVLRREIADWEARNE